MRAIKFLSLIALTAVISSCGIYKKAKMDDPIILNYAIPTGQTVVITSSGSSDIISEQMGQSIAISTESKSKMELASQENSTDNMNSLTFKYLEMEQKMSGPMGDGETDFSTVLNKEFSVDVAAKGECTNFEGFDDLEPIANALGEQIDAQVFQQGMEQMFPMLPDGPAKVGTTWSDDASTETPYGGGILKTAGTLNFAITEIKTVDDLPCVVIVSTGEFKTSGKFQQQGMDLELNRTSKTESTTIFAYTKGMFLSVDSKSTTTGSVEIPSMNMSIPQDIKGTGSFKVEFK